MKKSGQPVAVARLSLFQKALYIQTVVEKGISSVNSALRIQLSTIHSVELMERVRRVRDFPIQDCNPHII